jgi:hypothetical protein
VTGIQRYEDAIRDYETRARRYRICLQINMFLWGFTVGLWLMFLLGVGR